jgi:Tfp pilus assembly protein PilF
MLRAGWVLTIPLSLIGCVSFTVQERVQHYNDDGLYLFQQGQYLMACDSFAAALAVQPDDPALFYNIGQCYDRLGDAAQAERNYKECLQRAASHGECHHALVSLVWNSGRRQEAVAMVHEWLEREPQLAAAYAEDGWLWFQAGDLPRAQARFQQALELDPHEPRALIELARVYESLQRPTYAAALYERVLALNPKQTEVARRLNALRAQGVGQPQPD